MCGRTLISEGKELAVKAGCELGSNDLGRDTNRPPGTDMPVILDARPGKLHYVKWGLIPSGMPEPPKYATTYARIETMRNLSTYRELIGRRHCVFVVEGFYEFDKSQSPSQPYFFKRRDGGLLMLAGLWDTWKDPKSGIVIPSCTMIMQPANRFMGQIHDRMPCILSQADALTWLDRGAAVARRLDVLRPEPDNTMEGWQVSRKLNNARNKDANNFFKTGPQLGMFD